MKLLVASLFLGVLAFCAAGFAEDDIVLPPGGRVTVLTVPTTVSCEATFKRYCRCSETGFSNRQVLELILDDEGKTDELGIYDTREVCERSLHNNPACR